MTELVWIVVALPLLGAAVLVLGGRRIGEPWSGWLATGLVATGFVVAGVAFGELLAGSEDARLVLFSWMPTIGVDAVFVWDPLAATMTLLVTGVGALIHLYAIGYMHGDPRFGRFFGYLNLFISSMLVLVLAGNFAVLFVGWELVGLCSYLLISFWFERPSAAAAGKKAFIVNRIGDWGFLVAIMIVFATFGTLDFGEVFGAAPALAGGTATAITLLLFVGATGKSAQIPLYVWLPDAMEGPTPVSALIHAATMVTAGVYMIARTSPLFAQAPVTGAVVATVGAATALLAATVAVGQRDVKRVLAWSTISQLGYMVLGVGVAAYTAGIFHLLTQAFFKALLFLGAGSVIHAMGGEQDMWRMGGLRRAMPVTFATGVVAWLAISGVVPFSGFWSKDEILAATFARGGGFVVLWAVGLLTAAITAFYMTRWLFVTFLGEPRHGDHEPHESPATMTLPLVVLAVLAAFGGALNTPWGTFLERFLEPSFEGASQTALPEGSTTLLLAVISTVVVLTGIAVGWARYRGPLPAEEGGFWRAARAAYGVDELYGRLVVLPGEVLAYWTAAVDRGIVDGLVDGVGRAVVRLGGTLRGLQTGWVRAYALLLGAGTVGVLLVVLVRGGGL